MAWADRASDTYVRAAEGTWTVRGRSRFGLWGVRGLGAGVDWSERTDAL